MQQSDLEIILEDFGKTIKVAREIKSKERELMDSGSWEQGMFYGARIRDFRFDENTSIAWWGATEEFMPELPAGRPEDYLKIRDNYNALKAFIGTTLDRGQVHESYGTHAPIEHDFSLSEYVIWLYTFSENNTFKRNVERAVVELLNKELDRDFTNNDTLYQRAKGLLLDKIDRRHNGDVLKAARFIDRSSEDHPGNRRFYLYSVADVLSWIGLENSWKPGEIKLIDSEKRLKQWFENGMASSVRPETLEEWGLRFYGKGWEEKRKDVEAAYKRENIANRPVFHGQEVSKEVQEKYAERYLEFWPTIIQKGAETLAYDRLTGLLEVISSIGKQNNGFAGSYQKLKQKAETGMFKNFEDVKRGYGGKRNIFNNLLLALGAVQQGDELRDFWLSNIRDDDNTDRVITSVHGMLTAYEKPEERRMQIPDVLQKLHERGGDVDRPEKVYNFIGYREENLLDMILSHVADLCYERDTFNHFDRKTAALDFLVSFEIGTGKYSFKFHRSTPEGSRDLSATYNMQTDSFDGNTELETTIRAYFKQGYPVPDDVTVTSLEGRRIGQKTKVLEMSDTVKGKYEGVIGISGTHFPFLYDAETGDLRIGKPINSTTYAFGGGRDWEKSRLGFNEVKKKIAYTQLAPVNEANALVADSIRELKESKRLFDSRSLLEGKDFNKLGEYITNIVQSRLVVHGDGLVR